MLIYIFMRIILKKIGENTFKDEILKICVCDAINQKKNLMPTNFFRKSLNRPEAQLFFLSFFGKFEKILPVKLKISKCALRSCQECHRAKNIQDPKISPETLKIGPKTGRRKSKLSHNFHDFT